MRVRTQFEVMRFPSYAFDPATGVATFDYLLDGPAPLAFTETITFPVRRRGAGRLPPGPGPAARGGRGELLQGRRAAADRGARPVPAEAAALFTAVYTHGLAEYAYRNDLPFVLDLVVEVPELTAPATPVDNADGRPLSAVGGGKDSIVTLEILRGGRAGPGAVLGEPEPGDRQRQRRVRAARAGRPPQAGPAAVRAEQGRRAERAHPGHRDQLADRDRHRGAGTGSGRW